MGVGGVAWGGLVAAFNSIKQRSEARLRLPASGGRRIAMPTASHRRPLLSAIGRQRVVIR